MIDPREYVAGSPSYWAEWEFCPWLWGEWALGSTYQSVGRYTILLCVVVNRGLIAHPPSSQQIYLWLVSWNDSLFQGRIKYCSKFHGWLFKSRQKKMSNQMEESISGTSPMNNTSNTPTRNPVIWFHTQAFTITSKVPGNVCVTNSKSDSSDLISKKWDTCKRLM